MAQETLLTAARRLVRFLRIDLQKGGLVTESTEEALGTLDKMVLKWTAGVQIKCPHCQATLGVPMEDRPDIQ